MGLRTGKVNIWAAILVTVTMLVAMFAIGCEEEDPWTDDMYVKGEMYIWHNSTWNQITGETGGGGLVCGDCDLADLGDVGTASATEGNVLVADGDDFDSGQLDFDYLADIDKVTLDEEWDTEGKLEAIWGKDILLSGELDTEAELESLLSDVTDVFTNEDGSLAEDYLGDDSIEDLSDVDSMSPNDGQILVWSVGSGMWVAGDQTGGASQLSDLSDVASVSYTEGYVLVAGGSNFSAGFLDYDYLTNTDKVTLDAEWDTEGEVEIIWGDNIIMAGEIDSQSEIDAIIADGALSDDDLTDNSIEDLCDVDSMVPSGGQVLTWSDGLTKWTSANATGGASSLSELSDVGSTSYTDGYVLRADGDSYEEAQLDFDDLADTDKVSLDSEWDEESEVESAWGENAIVEGEIDSQAEFDAIVADGALADDDISDDSIENLNDVASMSPSNGDLFTWNTSLSVWESVGRDGIFSLSDLTDVGATSYTDGYVLRADGDSYEEAQLDFDDLTNTSKVTLDEEWNTEAEVEAIWSTDILTSSSSIEDLSDVNSMSPSNGEVLTYNGTATKWESGTVSADYEPTRVLVCASNCSGTPDCDYTCDGAADESQINTAIGIGKPIELSDGTFTLSDSITVTDNTFLFGAGNSTLITCSSNLDNGIGLIEDNCTNGNVTLSNFQIDGNCGNQANDQFGIYLTSTDFTTLEKLKIHDTSSNGIKLTNSEGCIIQSSLISTTEATGVYLSGCEAVQFKDSIIKDIDTFGVSGAYFYDSDYCSLSGITVDTVSGNGLYFEHNCDGNSLVKNTVLSTGGYGCYFYDNCDGNLLAFNVLSDITSNGMYLISGCDGNIMAGNMLAGESVIVVGFFSTADDNMITSNYANSLTITKGFSTTDNNMVEGNYLCTGGITDDGTNSRIIDNLGGGDCDWLADDEDASPGLLEPSANYEVRVVNGNVYFATHSIEYWFDSSDEELVQQVIREVVPEYMVKPSVTTLELTIYEDQDLKSAQELMASLGFDKGLVNTYLTPENPAWPLDFRDDVENLAGKMPTRSIALWYIEHKTYEPWTWDEVKDKVVELEDKVADLEASISVGP